MGDSELDFGVKPYRIQGISSRLRGNPVEQNLRQWDTTVLPAWSETIMGGIRSGVESMNPRVSPDSKPDNISRASKRGRQYLAYTDLSGPQNLISTFEARGEEEDCGIRIWDSQMRDAVVVGPGRRGRVVQVEALLTRTGLNSRVSTEQPTVLPSLRPWEI